MGLFLNGLALFYWDFVTVLKKEPMWRENILYRLFFKNRY